MFSARAECIHVVERIECGQAALDVALRQRRPALRHARLQIQQVGHREPGAQQGPASGVEPHQRWWRHIG